ncbi:Ppx/GppA phosphatase family protein [Melittangium boletus]|uniref:Exopolyphosphatase n=1 Tax=Melittangium boletus DSM 14713 TaxID=1294270 RepID=A0A250IPU4_9BACT|nr:exopolyphosphatase [Melittangium boletus]ATB33262.1 exopolyphosphatase [Melittangium boletus DSM 14713]
MATSTSRSVFAAIDVGTNAARLELARFGANGALETFLKERDAIRPGEGVFTHGVMPRETADRLVGTLRRYASLCRRHDARVRAVATSAMREAGNRMEILQRVRTETGLDLEVISGQEEARLICQGVLNRVPPRTRSMVMDLGGGSTEVVLATGQRPDALWSLPLGAVRLTELFDTVGEVKPTRLRQVRGFVEERLSTAFPCSLEDSPRVALGSSGTIRAVVRFAAGGDSHATLGQLSCAVEVLAGMSPAQRREHFEPRRADIIVAGAILLEQSARHLGLEGITAVKRGLRDGLLAELSSSHRNAAPLPSPCPAFLETLAVG